MLLLLLLWVCGQRVCVVQAKRHIHSPRRPEPSHSVERDVGADAGQCDGGVADQFSAMRITASSSFKALSRGLTSGARRSCRPPSMNGTSPCSMSAKGGSPADAVACRLRQAGRAVRYHRRRRAADQHRRDRRQGQAAADVGLGRIEPRQKDERRKPSGHEMERPKRGLSDAAPSVASPVARAQIPRYACFLRLPGCWAAWRQQRDLGPKGRIGRAGVASK